MRAVLFKNGRRVCPIGQGTYLMGRRRSEEVRALRRGVELGMEVIDTAEMYGTEDLVGEAVRGCRERAFLVSKVLPENADYAGTKRACEGSLRRLGTDYIDLYLLHWKGSFPISETVRAMAELKREGKIFQWDMSNLDVGDMQNVLSLPDGGDCAADQVLYNMESRGAEYDLIPWCARRGIPVMAYTPFGGGMAMHGGALAEIARRRCATPAQVMLAWAIRGGVIAIPKAGGAVHVDENFRSLNVELTEEDLRDIDAAFPAPNAKNSPRRLVGLGRGRRSSAFRESEMPLLEGRRYGLNGAFAVPESAAAFRRRQSRADFGRFAGSGRRYRTGGRGWTAASLPSSAPRSGCPSGSSSTGTFFHLPPTFATIIL